MRISSSEREIIKKEAKDVFGSSARVLLFGSRADDAKKGGDIDLLIEADDVIVNTVKKRMMLMTELQFKLGERKIDIIAVSKKDKSPEPFIVKIARETGIEL